jgi:murein DD-endopeptidase MepM/ murein hydrolase activator NlpD
MRYLLLTFILVSSSNLWSQFLSTQGNWALPMDAPVELSAGFGDLRPNHFHMGIDIRTGGKINLPIYACDEGFVSRIRVSSLGYGWVLYVQHPNGYTTVYAHCTSFAERIQQVYLDSAQARQNNEIDLLLPPSLLQVKKGEWIANSGNTGGSTGPHLHFELRDTHTEHALNPFLHGFSVSDHAQPILQGIRIYAVDTNGYLIPGKALNVPMTLDQHRVFLPPDFLDQDSKIGLALEVTDFFSNGGRSYGLFSAEALSSANERFTFEFDEIDFEDSRYINTHHDAVFARTSKRKYQKLFKSKFNPLTIYAYEGNGSFILGSKDSLQIQIMLRDVNGNETQHTLMILNPHEKKMALPNYQSQTHWLPNAVYDYRQGAWAIHIDSFTFYEPVPMKLNFQSKTIGSTQNIVQKPIEITYTFSNESMPHKYCITINGAALSGKYDNGKLIATTKVLGTWGLRKDVLPPTIKENPKNKLDSISSGKFYWIVTDDFSGLAYYACFQNGKWVPAYYDAKTKQISAQFITPFKENDNLVLLVKDGVGNEAKKEWKVPSKQLMQSETQQLE